MSILGINTSAIPPRRDVAPGTYTFRIISMKCRDDEGEFITAKESDRQLVKVALQAVDEPATNPVFVNLMNNIEGDSDDFVRSNEQTTADFINCFSLDHELDLDELCESAPGNEGKSVVNLQKSGPFEGSPQITRYLVE